MNKRFFLDTSAYLAVLLGEAGSGALVRELARGELLVSSLLVIEAHRNLIRLSREGWLTRAAGQNALERLEADIEQMVVRDLTIDLCRRAPMPVLSTPRSLDLAHLRTAMWFHERAPLTRFVSLDAAQKQAARELGLPV